MPLQEVTRAEFRRLIRGPEAEYSTTGTPAGWYACKGADFAAAILFDRLRDEHLYVVYKLRPGDSELIRESNGYKLRCHAEFALRGQLNQLMLAAESGGRLPRRPVPQTPAKLPNRRFSRPRKPSLLPIPSTGKEAEYARKSF